MGREVTAKLGPPRDAQPDPMSNVRVSSLLGPFIIADGSEDNQERKALGRITSIFNKLISLYRASYNSTHNYIQTMGKIRQLSYFTGTCIFDKICCLSEGRKDRGEGGVRGRKEILCQEPTHIIIAVLEDKRHLDI